MDLIGLTTPALLFPAISLLLLAYTNRFLVIGNLIRTLYKQYHETPNHDMKAQIDNLRHRAGLIRRMQLTGVASFIFATLTMMALLAHQQTAAMVFIAISLVLLLVSLIVCLLEIYISANALEVHLQHLTNPPPAEHPDNGSA